MADNDEYKPDMEEEPTLENYETIGDGSEVLTNEKSGGMMRGLVIGAVVLTLSFAAYKLYSVYFDNQSSTTANLLAKAPSSKDQKTLDFTDLLKPKSNAATSKETASAEKTEGTVEVSTEAQKSRSAADDLFGDVDKKSSDEQAPVEKMAESPAEKKSAEFSDFFNSKPKEEVAKAEPAPKEVVPEVKKSEAPTDNDVDELFWAASKNDMTQPKEVEPKAEPKAEQIAEPKAAPKTEPKAESKAEFQAEPVKKEQEQVKKSTPMFDFSMFTSKKEAAAKKEEVKPAKTDAMEDEKVSSLLGSFFTKSTPAKEEKKAVSPPPKEEKPAITIEKGKDLSDLGEVRKPVTSLPALQMAAPKMQAQETVKPAQIPAPETQQVQETMKPTAKVAAPAAMPVENKIPTTALQMTQPSVKQAPVMAAVPSVKHEQKSVTVENSAVTIEMLKQLEVLQAQNRNSQQSLQRFEQSVSLLQSAINRLNQRVQTIDMESQKRVTDSTAERDREMIDKHLMRKLASKVAMAPSSGCYHLVSMSAMRAIVGVGRITGTSGGSNTRIQRRDNVEYIDNDEGQSTIKANQQWEVYLGSRIPEIRSQQGGCKIVKGSTLEVVDFDTESGAVKLSNGLKIDAESTYYVDAMVTGRAWLKGQNGSTLTVDEGAILPGYGRVTNINQDDGIVETSSGRVINYHLNER